MRRTLCITIICSALITLLLAGSLQWGIRELQEHKSAAQNWQDNFERKDPTPCKGRIVHIAPREIHGGTILYLDTGWNMTEELVQIWIYEDTILLGEYDGKTMQQLVAERATDIYVETVLFPFRSDIIENTRLYPAMTVSISEDLQQ